MVTNPALFQSAVADRVRDKALASGYSDKALAEASAIPRATLVRRLAGATPFTVAELRAIATVLDCDPRDFLAEDAA